MHPKRPELSTLALCGLLAACGVEADNPNQTPPPGELQRSSLARNLTPQVSAAQQQQVVADNTEFALAFHREARRPGDNLFYSPFSISSALAMTFAGARGQTEQEMAQTLRFRLAQADLHPAFNWLDLELARRGQNAQGADGKPFRLRNVNGLFGQKGYQFLPTFLDTLGLNYGAGLSLLDFIEQTEESRKKINAWVADATEDRIDELLVQGVLDASTRLVLVNAIYFNAGWKKPFDKDLTRDGNFLSANGPKQVPTMHAIESFGYAEDGDAFAVVLPFDGDELEMLVVVPKGNLEDYEDKLDVARLNTLLGAVTNESLDLSFPKFEFRWKDSLAGLLQNMGMNAAFGDADFSGMDGTRSLQIADVIHEAFVKVNENGTEAAAATAVVIRETSVPVGRPVAVDRPFLFFIRDRGTGSLVFAGRVVDPNP